MKFPCLNEIQLNIRETLAQHEILVMRRISYRDGVLSNISV